MGGYPKYTSGVIKNTKCPITRDELSYYASRLRVGDTIKFPIPYTDIMHQGNGILTKEAKLTITGITKHLIIAVDSRGITRTIPLVDWVQRKKGD